MVGLWDIVVGRECRPAGLLAAPPLRTLRTDCSATSSPALHLIAFLTNPACSATAGFTG